MASVKKPVTVPYMIKEKVITEFEVTIPGFEAFAAIAERAKGSVAKDSNLAAVFRAERIKTQTKFIDKEGGKHTIDGLGVLGLPIALAKAIIAELDGQPHEMATILSEGDGISKAIRIQLGSPIELNKDTKISELEFLAQVYGDVENVLVEDNMLEQALALLRKVAKPVGGTILAIPSSAISQITIQDGFFVVEKVLPSFLE